jgi:hypothetical protein
MKEIFVIGAARSGTTITAEILDKYEGHLTMPSSIFPLWLHHYRGRDKNIVIEMVNHLSVLDILNEEDKKTIKNEIDYSSPNWKEDFKEALAQLSYEKLGRDGKPDLLIWKSNRYSTLWAEFGCDGDKFIVLLKRNIEDRFVSCHKTWSKLRQSPFKFSYIHHSFYNPFITKSFEEKENHITLNCETINEEVATLEQKLKKFKQGELKKRESNNNKSWGSLVGEAFPNVHGRVSSSLKYIERKGELNEEILASLKKWDSFWGAFYNIYIIKELDIIARKRKHMYHLCDAKNITIGE